MATMEDSFPDGTAILKNRNWDALNPKSETFKEQQEKDRKARDKLAAALWKAETDKLRIHKDFYTGDVDAFHEGPHCSGCTGEMEEGYSGGGQYCCCYEGKTPLEQWGNPVKYPPVNGEPPVEFKYYGPRTQERFLARFKDQLK